MKRTNILCVQNSDFFNVKTGDTNSYHLNGLIQHSIVGLEKAKKTPRCSIREQKEMLYLGSADQRDQCISED
jgi:hypothetical protein